MNITAGTLSQSIAIRAMADSSVLTGLTASDFSIWYRRNGDKQTITLSDLTSIDAVYASGGIIEIDDGWYRLDLPNAAIAVGTNSVIVGGSAAGGVLLTYPITLDVSELGPGGTLFEIAVTETGGTPISGADVWVSTDADGLTVVAGKRVSGVGGLVSFMLDAGTYYLWKQLDGYNFTNPQTITVV